MKFIADAMIGKLTRWLRILGHDVKYLKTAEDSILIKTARDEKRILLTKDKELYYKARASGIDTYLIEGKSRNEVLAELARHFGFVLEMNMDNSRCPKCNGEVISVSKKEVADKLNKSTYSFYDSFWSCSVCGQIYWKGSHWKRIKNTLLQASKHKNSPRCDSYSKQKSEK